MIDTTNLNAALAYARQLRWAVFPLHAVDAKGQCTCHRGSACDRAGKHPRTRQGLKEATTDVKIIRRWWVEWPDANVGVATGTASGFDALDVDPRHGGEESLEDLEAQHGVLPDTVEQHTGGGGRHLLFAHQDGVRNKAGLAPGLDVRGDGGYIVVPPSRHASGQSYVWEASSRPEAVALAPWPSWLLPALQSGGNGQTPALEPLADAIPEGSRNETLFRQACKLRRQGFSPEGIAAALQVENQRCAPPLPETEIQQIAASTARYTPATRYSPAEGNGRIGEGPPPGGGNGHPPAAGGAPVVAGPPGYALTDMGNAQRLVALHGSHLRYCYDWGAWLTWDGRRWQKDHVGAVEYQAKQTVRTIYQEAGREADDAAAKALVKHAFRSQNKARVDALVSLAQSEPDIPLRPEDLDTNPWAVNVRNGTLDLRTGRLRSHEPTDLITKLAPVPYEPGATCPLWEAFLDRIMAGNEALIGFLQRAVGYALTGSTRAQVMFILYGEGANGKSTFLETLQTLFGDYAQQSDAATFAVRQHDGPRNDVARLMGARLVATIETEEGQRLSEVLVKQVTGGDTITARFLHQEFFEFKPQFKLFLATNHKPEIWGTDHAIWRRIRLIPFTVTIPPAEQDEALPDKLVAELPGILAWAVEGCRQWLEQGLEEPDAVRAATGAYRDEMDLLAGFLSACCVLETRAQVWARDLYRAYQAWCQENGERELAQRTFGRKLTERGVKKQRSTGGKYVYLGLGLRADLAAQMNQMNDSERNSGVLPTSSSRIEIISESRSLPSIGSLEEGNRLKKPPNGADTGYEEGIL